MGKCGIVDDFACRVGLKWGAIRGRSVLFANQSQMPPKTISNLFRRVHYLFNALIIVLGVAATSRGADPPASVDLSAFHESAGGVKVLEKDQRLEVSWPIAEARRGVLVLDLTHEANLISALGMERNGEKAKLILTDVQPVTWLTVGVRDLSAQGWDVFFDNPPKRPHETFAAKLDKQEVTVTTSGPRVTIAIDTLSAGPFSGQLSLTLYPGCPLVHVEAVLSSERDACAILYDAGLASSKPSWQHVAWLDTDDQLQRRNSKSEETAVPFAVRRRTIVAESEHGSVAIFPPPHQFLYPLDFVENFKFTWQGQNYRESGESFGLGVRQPPEGDKRFVPWINAPPKSKQRLGVFYLLSDKDAAAALDEAGKFTRGDRFQPVPGYRTFTSHYHIEHTLNLLDQQRQQATTGIPQGLEEPSFVQAFRDRGVEIVHLAEFHVNHSPDFREKRLEQLAMLHRECRRLSNDKFLLLPGEEPNVHLGGHWISLFPKPVYWILHPGPDVPFEREVEGLGKVYAVHNAAEVLKLMEKENGLMWTAHPRTKSSYQFPDRYRAEPFYQSDRFLGAAWKALPADLSKPRLGVRALNLLDDMANWGQRKFMLGEVDVFKVQPDYELYGPMNINYLKLDKLPRFDDGWQSVLDALRGGRFFVSTGEVLIPEFRVGGKESGDFLKRPAGQCQLTAHLEWTFPPAFAEIIWGDGKQTHRVRQDLSAFGAFGQTTLNQEVDLPGAKWARLEVWDVAANGGFTQPVWIE